MRQRVALALSRRGKRTAGREAARPLRKGGGRVSVGMRESAGSASEVAVKRTERGCGARGRVWAVRKLIEDADVFAVV